MLSSNRVILEKHFEHKVRLFGRHHQFSTSRAIRFEFVLSLIRNERDIPEWSERA